MPPRRGPTIQGARLSVVSALVALVVCIVVTPTLSAGSTVTVCSVGCNFVTIAGAVNAALANDVILVHAGTYTEPATNTSIPLTIMTTGGDVHVNGPDPAQAWLSVSSSEWVMNGSFVLNGAPMRVLGNTTWNQYGTINIYLTLNTASGYGVQFGSGGGTWNQYGTVSITMVSTNNMVSGYGVSFDGSGGGTWNQNGAVTITITSNSSPGAVSTGVFFSGLGGTWNQNGATNITTFGSTGALCLGLAFGGRTWNQNGALTITTFSSTGSQGYGVQFVNGIGTWNQCGTVLITTTITTTGAGGAGVHLGGGTWNQNGIITITITTNSSSVGSPIVYGVLFESTGTWNQNGTATINMAISINTGSSGYGVYFYRSVTATWNQNGAVTITTQSTGSSGYGMYFDGGGTWNQNGTVIITTMGTEGYGVSFDGGGTWNQNGAASTIRSAGVGVLIDGGGTWHQDGTVAITITINTGTLGYGVRLGSGTWYQYGAVTITSTGSAGSGVYFLGGSGATWFQYGSVNIAIRGDRSCGVDLNAVGLAPWRQVGPFPVLDITGQNSSGVCPALLPSPSVQALQVEFNLTTPIVAIRPDGGATPAVHQSRSVRFGFASLEEIAPNGTVVQRASLQDGLATRHPRPLLCLQQAPPVSVSFSWYSLQRLPHIGGWTASNLTSGKVSGNATTLVFASALAHNNATVVYTFATFANATVITLGNNATLTETPQYLKFSMRLAFWNWTSTANRLRFAMSVEPGFNRSETRTHTPQADVTTVLTHSADPGRASALVRLLNYGLSGPEGARVNCTVGADASVASLVTMTFDYFGNRSLDYDPDLSLVLGRQRGGDGDGDGGGGTSEGLIVGVAVAVPAAVAAVAAVSGGALAIAWVRARRAKKGGVVNYSDNDQLEPNDGL